jgi:hypothetical protein
MGNYCYTYQHTCENGHDAYLLQNAPFKAAIKKSPNGKIKIPFLGEGHYLWEENVVAANRWGVKHYANKYRVIEYQDLNIPNDLMLDLTDRRHIRYFKELQLIYIEKRPASANWPIGAWIEFFKKLHLMNEVEFPFNYIKADEHLPEKEKDEYDRGKTYFADGLPYYTYLEPLYMLCIIDKKQMSFREKRLL